MRPRPDRRTFLAFSDCGPEEYGPLVESAAAANPGPLFASVPADGDALPALLRAGFVEELIFEHFRVRFDVVLARLPRDRVPRGVAIVPARDVDEDRLFTLDNTLRQDVPGTDGWRGNREWFRDEMTDRAAYHVAVDQGNGEYVGLARIWHDDADPNFGLLGVVRQYRRTSIAAALARAALAEAASWGIPAFVTGACVDNPQTYPVLVRLGGERLGRRVQLVRR